MDVQLDGLHDGDRIQVEYTQLPMDVYAESDAQVRARIIKIEGGGNA
jgi:hypothetical protein